jgi:uncharacterized repeat protein (TIGR01451 family)
MKNNFFSKCLRLFLVASLFVFHDVKAQSTSPTPYCYPTASSMVGGTCTIAGFSLASFSLNGISQSSSCYGSANTDVYRYWTSTTTLLGGQTYTMEIVSASGPGYLVSGGAWIDYNQNNSFDSLELIGASMVSNNNINGPVKQKITFTVPCSVSAGTTRLRVRLQGMNQVKGNHACSVPSTYGETWDFDVTITQPSSVNANFSSEDTVFVKTAVKFTNANIAGYFQHVWDANNDGSVEANNSKDFTYSWASTGTKCVKLKSSNCYGTDSTVKCITVIAPTAAPVASFSSCVRVVQQYETVQFFDESSNGPWQWTWDVYDSTSFAGSLWTGEVVADPFNTGNNEFSANPQFQFDVPGLYTIRLVVKNDIGTSQSFVKTSFVKVVRPTLYYLGYGAYGKKGDNVVNSNAGIISDDGGPNLNYGHNQTVQTRSFLVIMPENPTPVTLEFKQLKLADTNDIIKIYDDVYANPAKLMASLTSTNNGTFPTYTSTTNRMYVAFTSNNIGTDAGYYANYYTDGYGPLTQNVELGHAVLLTNVESKIYNMKGSRAYENYYKRWKIDGVYKPSNDGLDTLKHVFTDTTNHTVCVELSNCDTAYTVCKRLLFERGISGNLFKDLNSNCVFDGLDKGMDNIRLKLYDGSNNLLGLYSSSEGAYSISLDSGNYKLAVDTAGVPYTVGCTYPGVDSVLSLTGVNPMATDVNFDIECRNGFDIGVQSVVTRGAVFPGRQHLVRVLAGDLTNWYGLKCATGKSGTVKVTITGPVSYAGVYSGALTPSVSGNVFTYAISDFANLDIRNAFAMTFNTDTSAQAGDTVRVLVEVTPTSGDGDTSNNKKEYMYLTLNSYDPNMKEVFPIDVPPLFNDWLTYTIHFQNTGNAPAYNIRLADTLASQFDLSTFQVLNHSHTMNTALTGNALSFRFPNIMLADSFSNEKASHGYVQYRIRPKSGLGKGTKINNTAYIYFDYNPAVVTNTTVNEFVEKNTSIKKVYLSNLVKVYPNPNNGVFRIELPRHLEGVSSSIEIYDILGELVQHTSTSGTSVQADLSNRSPGVYLVKVIANGLTMNAYIVKQ